MSEWMLNPAVQSGVLPALAAMVAAVLFGRTRALVLVPMAGFAVVVWVAVGVSLEPMTARSKLVVAVAAAGVIALVLDLWRQRASIAFGVVLGVLAAAAAVWISIRVVAQKEGAAAWLLALAAVVWSVAMVESMRLAAGDNLRTLVASTVLGFACGALGLLGATASVAMMGIAFGASCGIAALAVLVGWQPRAELWFVGLPVAAFAAFGGLVASLTGDLPGRALVPLIAIPVAVRLVPRGGDHRWREAILWAVAAAIPALAASALAVWPAPAAPA